MLQFVLFDYPRPEELVPADITFMSLHADLVNLRLK
jgi:hypothetical protein